MTAAQIETENNAVIDSEAGTICVPDSETRCTGRVVKFEDFKNEPNGSVLKELYEKAVGELFPNPFRSDLTPEQEQLVANVLQARLHHNIELHFFASEDIARSIVNELAVIRALPADQQTALEEEFGSLGAAALMGSLDSPELQSSSTGLALLEAAFDFVDQTDSAVIVGGAVIGTADGVIDGAVDTVKLAADVASDPVASYRRAKEIIDYARENPEEFFAALTEEGVKAFRALQSDFNEFQFALATDSRITSADSVNDVLNLFDRGALFETSEDLGHTIGPFIVGAGAGGALLKVGRVGDIISDIAKSGKRPETQDVDAPNTGDRGANADAIDAQSPSPTAGQAGDNEIVLAPQPLPREVVELTDANPPKGTPEYDLLNNPPANTEIRLPNGNVYRTNADGIVEEVAFTPRLIKQPRDARQTAVGKEGLDTDVGGHIQGCSLGGTCDRVNLFPQDANFNNSAYKTFENEIRRALDRGDDVGPVNVRFVRSDPSNPRPDRVVVKYTINGETREIPFRNQAGG